MRKIEADMVRAVRELKPARLGNTVVTVSDRFGWADVHLHGNRIATVWPERSDGHGPARHIEVTLAGWDTPTTRSRLRALLRAFSPDVVLVHHKGRTTLESPEVSARVDLPEDALATVNWTPIRHGQGAGLSIRGEYRPNAKED